MIGIEHEFDHTDRLTEELKVHGKYMSYNRPIQLAYVNGVPYNPMDRMERTDDGWKCNSCGLKIGKHLYRIGNIKVIGLLSQFNKEAGRPKALLEGYGTIGK